MASLSRPYLLEAASTETVYIQQDQQNEPDDSEQDHKANQNIAIFRFVLVRLLEHLVHWP